MCPKNATDQFPNVICYAPTKQILAMYGNPHTPLLPQFPNNIWSSNTSTPVRCSGCGHIIPEELPQSPTKKIEAKGSYNITSSDCNILSENLQMPLNNSSSKHFSTKYASFGKNGPLTNDCLKSPAMISSAGNSVGFINRFH